MLSQGKVLLTESVAALKEQHEQQKLEDIFIKLVEEEQRKNP